MCKTLPDYVLKVINIFQKFVDTLIIFFEEEFGIIGKYIIAPAIRLIAISLYPITFIFGVTVYISILGLATLIRKINLLIRYIRINELSFFWIILLFIALCIFIKYPLQYLIVSIVSAVLIYFVIKFSSEHIHPHS
jgi:uncharacterized membrane protein YhaH (DUF805 family)